MEGSTNSKRRRCSGIGDQESNSNGPVGKRKPVRLLHKAGCPMLATANLRFPMTQSKGRNLALWRFDFFLAWGETAENFRDLLGHFPRLGERLKLFVYVCCVSLFTRPDGADDDKPLVFVDSINDPVRGKFVLPVEIQRGSQGKSVALGIDREFFRQNLL